MKITLVTSGTRGDVQPMAVLGVELTRRGHDVTLGVPPNLVETGLRCGLRTHAFGPDTLAFMESPEGQRWLAAGDVTTFMNELMAVSRSVIDRTMRETRELTDGADLVVGDCSPRTSACPPPRRSGCPMPRCTARLTGVPVPSHS